MQTKKIVVPPMKSLIKKAPGFEKKKLAEYKLDILALCGFGCRYCSSNMGNYLRIHQEEFAQCAESQMGRSIKPSEDPSLMMVWPDVVSQLEDELSSKPKQFGIDKTLMFSMLTDGFSPELVRDGTTRAVLELVLERTSFRIRVLTKNAVVGNDEWIQFFRDHKDRFVVGLSTGSLDDKWARKMELGTSSPTERFNALRRLQEAGVPTFGMLCPVFPDMLEGDSIEKMIEMINPDAVEHFWAEPYNDRINWRIVRSGYPKGSPIYEWFTNVYEYRMSPLWSQYTTELYKRLKYHAVKNDWLQKLRYLLYEDGITESDALAYKGLGGVLLQSNPGEDGRSQNPSIADLQEI